MVFEKQGHVEQVSGVAFAPDGLSFASVGGNIQLWNAMTGAEILNLQPPGRNVDGKQGLAFSLDGKLLAASRGVNIHVWNASTGASRLVIPKAYQRDVIFLIFHDNTTLISSEWGHVRFWDVTTGKQIREFNPKGTNYGASIALSRNGKLLAMAALNKIDIIDASTGESIQVVSDYYNSFGPSTNHLAFSPDAATLAAKAGGNVVRVWDIKTGKRQLAFDDAHSACIRSAAFSPNGRQALTAGNEEAAARLWDVGTGKQLRVFHNQETNIHRGESVATWSSDGKWIATGGYEHLIKGGSFRGSCRIWDAATGKELWVQGFPHRITHLAFTSNGEDLAIATEDIEVRPAKNCVYLWPFLKDKEPIKVTEQDQFGDSVALSANGKTLALVGLESVHIWDIATRRQQAALDLPTRAISAAFSPDGKLVVTSEWPGDRLFVMEVTTGRLSRTIKVSKTYGNTAAFSPDGRIMASCQRTLYGGDSDLDHSIHLWEIETGKEVLRFHAGTFAVSTLAFSNDGSSLITGTNNGTALIWNLSDKLPKPLMPHDLMPQDLESLWVHMADQDASKAHKALWTLMAAAKQSVPFLRNRLKPAALADQAKIQEWIADLDNDKFAIRQAAVKQLEKVGGQGRAPIQEALKGNLLLQTSRRLEQILNTLSDVPGPETLRTIRAIMVLERIGSPEAQGVLETLAHGAPAARETEEAKGSLERLARRVSRAR
jgi:WD40 repeat protein